MVVRSFRGRYGCGRPATITEALSLGCDWGALRNHVLNGFGLGDEELAERGGPDRLKPEPVCPGCESVDSRGAHGLLGTDPGDRSAVEVARRRIVGGVGELVERVAAGRSLVGRPVERRRATPSGPIVIPPSDLMSSWRRFGRGSRRAPDPLPRMRPRGSGAWRRPRRCMVAVGVCPDPSCRSHRRLDAFGRRVLRRDRRRRARQHEVVVEPIARIGTPVEDDAAAARGRRERE